MTVLYSSCVPNSRTFVSEGDIGWPVSRSRRCTHMATIHSSSGEMEGGREGLR